MNQDSIARRALLVFATAVALTAGIHSNAQDIADAVDIASPTSIDARPEATAFPRTLTLSTGTFTLYEPQIQDHAGFTEATAWSAAAYTPSDGETVFGAIKFRAKLVVDTENRLVTVYDREVLEVKFSELDEIEMAFLRGDLLANIRTQPESIPLDVMLGYVVGDATDVPSIEISLDSPTIFYATSPTMLVVLDGEPIKVAIEDADGLSVIVNTNWDLFYSETTETYSLLLGDYWLRAASLDGPWEVADAPDGIAALPDDDRWTAAKEAVPGSKLAEGDTPEIRVAQAPAELIVTEGAVELEPIPETQLSFVANSASDIVFNGEDEHYYFLTSGRWFNSTALDGDWNGVETAPEAFQKIPSDHPRAYVRASVAGTPEAALAVAQAQVPQTAEVSRETQAPDVHYAGEPNFEKIEGADVLRATNTTFDVFFVEGRYYLCHDAVWFVADEPSGPWVITDTLPTEIFDIPPDSPAHNVTYVKVYESTPDAVYFGYTPGYHYSYVSGGTVVYGSGYYYGTYYDPYYYSYYYPSWYYYPYPSTYGQASIYNTTTGTYVHGHYAYGPYGGYWAGTNYNPNTGRYGGGAYAYDYDTAVYEGWSYNPRTNTSATTSQATQWSDGNSYESWGETVIQRDDNWVSAERYGTEDGFRREVETSAGGQAVQAGTADNRVTAGQTSDGDLYAGANGSVFRRTEDGEWEARQDGEWTSVDTEAARTEASNRATDMDLDRESFDQPERLSDLQTNQGFDFDRQSLERDLAARTGGRSRYDSFRSGAGSFGGFSGGGGRLGGRLGR
ncbi:MAG: hypothetical protein AAGJ84_05970 [Pseudomonadota bacterium]